jgi:hypothetical protein
LIGNNIPSKIFAGTVNWVFHLVSDMSGFKEVSMMPVNCCYLLESAIDIKQNCIKGYLTIKNYAK